MKTAKYINKTIRLKRNDVYQYYHCYGISPYSENLLLVSEPDNEMEQYWLTLTDPSILEVSIVNIPNN